MRDDDRGLHASVARMYCVASAQRRAPSWHVGSPTGIGVRQSGLTLWGREIQPPMKPILCPYIIVLPMCCSWCRSDSPTAVLQFSPVY